MKAMYFDINSRSVIENHLHDCLRTEDVFSVKAFDGRSKDAQAQLEFQGDEVCVGFRTANQSRHAPVNPEAPSSEPLYSDILEYIILYHTVICCKIF